MIKLGDSNINFAVGNSAVTYIYLGSTLIYDATPVETTAFTATYNNGSDPISVNCADLTNGQLLSANTKPLNRVASAMSEAVISDCVTYVAADAFRDCSGLTAITIPDTVSGFGDSALRSCTSLSSVTLPSGLTSITSNLMRFCLSLTSITIPDRVTSIGDDAFNNCISLSSVTLPDSVTTIGNKSFAKCSGLTSCTLGSGVTNIDIRAFSACTSLTSMTINAVTPPTLGSDTSLIGSYPIYVPAESVQSYKDAWSAYTGYPERIEAIPVPANYKFRVVYNNGDPDLVVVPSGVTDTEISWVEMSPYSGANSAITDIYIGDGITLVAGGTFKDCPSLTAVTIPDSVRTLYYHSFQNTSLPVVNNIQYADKWAISATTNQSSFTLEDGTVGIARYAFSGSPSLVSVTIPNSMKHVNYQAFYNCTLSTLSNIKYAGDNIVCYNTSRSQTGYTLKDTTQFIIGQTSGSYGGAFESCTSLKNMTLPSGVKEIGESAFKYCRSLSSMTLSENLETIYDYAFSGCTALRTLSLPSTLKYIGTRAFVNCVALQTLSLPSSLEYLGDYAFYNASGLTTIAIPSGITVMRDGLFGQCKALTSVTLPDNVTYIGGSVFQGCSGLTNVNIPSELTYIGDSAFYGCRGLTSFTANKVETIGNYVFQACYGLLNASFTSCTTVGNGAFAGEASLTSITIPNVTSVHKYAFQGCTGLPVTDYVHYADNKVAVKASDTGQTTYTILPTVITITDQCFNNCTNLESITIPASVNVIGSAFQNCTSLTSVTLVNQDVVIDSYAFQGCTGLPQTNYFYLDDSGAFILGLADGEQTSYTIPDGVSVVPDGLFNDAWNVQSITLPSSTTKINGQLIQWGMSPLTITCNATTVPATTSDRPFGNDVQNIYVPAESVDAYKAAWTQYASVIEAIS